MTLYAGALDPQLLALAALFDLTHGGKGQPHPDVDPAAVFFSPGARMVALRSRPQLHFPPRPVTA